MNGSYKYQYGDNIYHIDPNSNEWLQEDSHHSKASGEINPINFEDDLKDDSVLISDEFTYWGGQGPVVPENLEDICFTRGRKKNFPDQLVSNFLQWINSLNQSGVCGEPAKWSEWMKKVTNA